MERIRKGTETTKKKFPFSVELIAVCMIFIFSWDQVVFADGIPPQDFEKLPALPAVDVTQAASLPVSTPLSEAPSSTQDFLSNGSPLKIPMSVPPKAVAAPKILQSPNPSNGWQLKFTSEADLSYEIQVSADLKNWLTRAVVKADASETSWEDPLAAPGSMRFYRVGISNAPVSGVQYHVYAGDAVQQVIDRAVGSDSVYLHSGVYHQSLILKKDVNLEGEDQKQTIIDGDYAAGKAVLRALGGNRIENLTVRDVRSLQGQTVGAISVEGDQVQVRGDLITNNLGAGIKITAEASGILIEANTFVENNIAIQGAQDGNVIRYNTITGNNPVPAAPAITGVSYVPNQGFRIQIARATGVFSYHVEYSSDLKKWNRVQRALSPGVFEDVLVLANPAGVTTWLDTSATSAGFRFYRIVVAESLTSNTGIEVADGEAPLIENNIITDQKVQSIWEASPGYAVVENNVLFKNGEVGDATGRHLPPAISPQAGSGLPNANVLRDPEFVNPSTGDYTSVNTADAGSFMLASLRSALDRASLFETANVIESIQENGQVSGYRILYAEGSREEFYNDGRRVLDTAPPVITVLSSDVTDQSAYVFRYTLDGVEHHESRTLAEGSNDFNVTAADIFGNRASLSFTVTFERPPEIIVTSPSVASGASYEFIYTVDGVEARETWHLQPGATELLICASRGTATTRLSYTVTLPGTEADLMAMPDVPDTPQDLISLTAQNGLVLKYSNGVLFSIEQPGEYTLFDITLDAGKNLQGGMLRLANGDRILYQNGKPVYLLSSLGARTVYNENGAVAFVLTADHKKIRFAYRRNTAGKVLSVLSFEDGVTSLYDDKGRPLWIKKAGGTEILYQDGFLTDYSDASGNKFHYDVSPLQDGDSLRGYRSELVSVIPAGTGPAIPVATILDNLQDYPSIRDTLERQISRTLEYDASGNMVKVFSVNGEILELQKGLPVSLTNRSGEIFSVQTQVAEDQELLSISLSGNGLEQTYDGNGQLSGIRLEDGTFFQIREQGLDRISLEDGSVLSALVWNGQSLTGFKRLHPDGSVEVYSHSVITERTDAAGNRTLFVDDNGQREAGEIVTEDGKTYRVTSYPNSLGLTERLTELVRIDMPDGSRIEFEDGRPVRYIQPKQVQVDPFEVPDLVEGRFFVPLVELPVAKLRALTVDENGYIFSGEILFNDGTQYLIEDNAVVKQITAGGQFLEFSSTPSPGVALPRIPPEAMTGTEDAYRNHLLETQLDYFMDGKGIHSGTGLPVDHYTGADGKQSDYSQATLVGFWAEILAAIARGDFQNSRMTRSQAFEKLNALIANYQEVQRQAGWNGMVAFFSIVEKQEAVLDPYGNPTGQTRTVYSYKNSFDQYGFGDTLNLSVSLASVIGALQGIALDPELAVYRDQILSRTDQILSEQERGYAAFYDSSQERFHGAYLLDPSTHKWGFAKDYYLDRTFSEFLPGMVWLAARYPQYRQGFSNLGTTLRRYQTEGNGVLDLAVPFDGGAFQMFWPLIHVDETRYPEFEVALRNFLYAQAEFVDQHDIPGLLSAGDNPGQGYEGKIGLPAAAEADDVRYDSIGSLYGTAAAFGLAPHYTLQFLKNLETRFPEIRTSAGFVDALKMVPVTRMDPLTGKYVLVQEPVFSNQYFGVDQASFVLSLLRTSQDYFRNYLDAQGITGSFDTLYQSIQLNLKPLTSGNVEAPDFGQTMTSLYDGGSAMPDGRSAGLVKQAGFVPTIFDPELGEGHIYNYQKPDGTFQHTEIEFGEGDALRVMGIQEYLLRTHHTDMGRAILSGFELDLYNKSVSQGIFYTPDNGYASSMLVNDPELGEVRHVSFDFQDPQHAVGLWNRYDAPGLDLGQYDFLSIPVKIPDGTPENIRLKFEFRGTGNNFLTEPLHHGWQCITIPIARPLDGSVTQIATVIQSVSGQSVRGELYLGPLSAFKVRTSNRLDWGAMLGKTESEIRLLIQSKIATQAFDGGKRSADEVLEDFTIDSTGKLVSGVLKRADGGIQYFQNGQLVKWVFKNGRTVLYEKGIANFFVDLTRGKLETGRFYYDQDLKGEVHSFTLQDNDRKRIFASDGTLKTLIENGNVVEFRDGAIQSIQTTWGTLTQLEFADDGSLLRAHALLNDGRVIEIDERDGSVVGLGDGVQLFCRGTTIVGINTTQNGKTDLTYHYDAAGRIVGVDASFLEGGSLRTLSLFDYLQRPERRVEREQLISKTLDVLSIPDVVVGQFSYPSLPPGESICAWKEYDDSGTRAVFDFRYSSGNGGEILGMCLNHKSDPFEISNYGFLSVTLMQPPEMQWHQDLDLKIKGPYYNTLYSFEIKDLTSRYQTFEFPLAGKSGMEGELTFEVVREEAGEDQWGDVFFKDISYWTLRTLDRSPWEDQIGITAVQLLSLKIESENLTSVGAEIAAKQPLRYAELVPYLDTPTQFLHTDTPAQTNQLLGFRRFDGSQVELNGSDVSRVILPDGIVNEYAVSGNSAQGTLLGPGEDASTARSVSYSYGALRKITQPDGREYLLSYEFDGDGKEITVFKDAQSGEERRFKDGKILSSSDPGELETRYLYENGELLGAELTYRDRVLNSTQYSFREDGTQVTDERGTIWFYDASGALIKHMTRDGYLYEYSDYTQDPVSGPPLSPEDYKNAVFGAKGLRAVSLKGYQVPDGSWISWDAAEGSQIHLASGLQGANLKLDSEQRIESGQIQFPGGMLLEIEHYIPVRGRFEDGQTFEYALPSASDYELLQGEDGTYLGFRFKIEETTFTYDPSGILIKTETGDGTTNTFTYSRDAQGDPEAYARLEQRQIAFNGVPFPKEAELIAGSDQKLIDSGKETAAHSGNGFLVAVYKEATNQWDAYSGTFSAESDRIGLRHFLGEIKKGEYVAAVVSDPALSLAGEEIFALLEGLGAGQVRTAAADHRPWSFFGNEDLSAGQGFEAVGKGSFSTLTETMVTQNISKGQVPAFADAPLFFGMPQTMADAYDGFLKSYQPFKVARDLQSVTVYDTQDEIVFSRRLDGIHSYYEHGKIRETFDVDGTLLSVQEYACPPAGCLCADDMTLQKITLVKARQDFEAQTARLSEQVEQAKFDALYRLAWQDEVARAQIRENVDAGASQIDARIADLESQRFQRVKICKSAFFGIGKKCHEESREIPGVQGAIYQLAAQRAELLQTGESQLAAIPGAIAAKRAEIEQATAEKMAELLGQKEEFLLDILHQEMEPVLTDFYRRILGRDASQQEFDLWVNRSKTAGQLDTALLRSGLENSSERTAREQQKSTIIQGVRSFLAAYGAATPEAKAPLLQSLRLNTSEVVALDAEEVSRILDWLETRDLHFGQSAFLSLREMLSSQGVTVPMETIGQEAILIDILTGVITRFTEGDLLISMAAMDRTAALHARDFASVQYTYDDLRSLYGTVCGLPPGDCGLRVIAHVGEDHFVVVKRVTDTEVTYEETGKGPQGEEATVSKENFLKIWLETEDSGYLMIPAAQAIPAKKLSDSQAKKVRGAFFFIFFVVGIFLSLASMVVSMFSPTFGKILGYAALVAGIIGIVGSLGQFIVQGVKMVFSSIASQGIFATIKQGMAYVGKVLFESVKYVGRFIQKAFAFIANGFSGGLSGLGAGIAHLKSFLFVGAGKLLPDGSRAFTFAQSAARGLIAAGLNTGVSKGLEGMGLDPRLTQLAGAFVGGAFLGMGQTSASFLRSGLQHLLIQGVSEIGVHLGLAPPITGALSLLASTGLASLFSGNFSLKPFTEIIPQLASQFTLGGLELAGRSMGLNAQLVHLLGLPFAAISGNIANLFLNPGSVDFTPDGIFRLLKESLLSRDTLGGVFSLAAGFVMNKLDLNGSLLGSFSSRLIGGIFSDFAASPVRFSFADSLIKSTDESFYHFFDPVMLPQLFDAIHEHGLSEGLEQYATALFTRETLMEFTGAGQDLSQWIANGIPLADDIIYEGEPAKRFRMTQNGKSIVFEYVPKGTRLEIRKIYEEDADGKTRRLVQWKTDGEGKISEVLVTEQMPDGTLRTDQLDPEGRIREILFKDWNGQTYGRLSFNAEGALEFTNYELGISNYLTADGHFNFDVTLAPDLQDLNQLLYDFDTDLLPGTVAQWSAFTFGNGFWNSHQLPDSVPALMGSFMRDLALDQGKKGMPAVTLFDAAGNIARDRHGNILTTGALPVTLYEETSLVGNVFRWVADTWLGCNFMRDEIERELTRYLDLVKLNQERFGLSPDMQFVHFAHSGNFQPMVEALEDLPDEYRSSIKALVVYEGPYVGDGIIDDPFLETLVRVRGVKPGFEVPLLEHRDFQITDQNGKVLPLPNQYNIEIAGAGHSDFSYNPSFDYASAEEREIARKTSLFMRELTLAASEKPDSLSRFLSTDRPDGCVTKENGIYTIDPLKFRSTLDEP